MKIYSTIVRSAFLLFFFNSCLYGVNEKNSEIGTIHFSCDWDRFEKRYSTDGLKDSAYIYKLKEFTEQPFPVKVLYFGGDMNELIGIAENHYQVRYVYNPRISDQVLDGLSPQLNEMQKQLIQHQMDSVLLDFGCRKD